ncbi:MAG TPA: diadenylate cyclase CdaA [Limnochordia bacterium]|nr:diadenylate cyclase CdaA [Limnochordia bacterium]
MPTLSITAAFDILIVAFFVYKLMQLLRGTRATAIIKGLVLLVFANLAANFIGLRTVSWLLDRGTTVILVALPIVFYPELRRALEHLGRGQLFTRFSTSSLSHQAREESISALVRAAVYWSQTRTGALIAIEREIGLQEYIESGVRLDANISAELLQNIFVVDTPLHDGAAIVRGDNIVAAACLLPLTENPHVTRNLGTRHRAALGLSEQSDAVVLIVSEETGIVSLALAGRLERGLDSAALTTRLRELLGGAAAVINPFWHRKGA